MDSATSQVSGSLQLMRKIWPIMVFVFVFFLVIGAALPVLPLHVHDRLGMGTFVVGLVAGGQFIASLVSRLWAGRLADTRGQKFAVMLGFGAAIAGSLLYLASLALIRSPSLSVLALLLGRTFLGGAESLIITGAMAWGLAITLPRQAGKAIAWIGMAMFAALAAGAPLGSYLFDSGGFLCISALSLAVCIATLLGIIPLPAVLPHRAAQPPLKDVLQAVILPGVGFALSGITFGALTAFLTLFFSLRNWPHGALAFSTFSLMLIATRIVAGHLPDRLGGARVAIYSLVLQCAGLLLITIATSPRTAMLGSGLAGAGFSLVFPALGIEAVSRVPPASKGLAMGTYNAFLDLTLGLGSPALGFLAARAGLASVFGLSAIAAALAIPIAMSLQRARNCGR